MLNIRFTTKTQKDKLIQSAPARVLEYREELTRKGVVQHPVWNDAEQMDLWNRIEFGDHTIYGAEVKEATLHEGGKLLPNGHVDLAEVIRRYPRPAPITPR